MYGVCVCVCVCVFGSAHIHSIHAGPLQVHILEDDHFFLVSLSYQPRITSSPIHVPQAAREKGGRMRSS